MKKMIYIYQYNALINGHSIFDRRLCSALEKLYEKNFVSIQYNTQTNNFTDTTKNIIDDGNTIVVLSHFNTFKICGRFKKNKIVFLNHDLPYYAYLQQKNFKGLIKAGYSWIYIHYYWKFASFIFFISKVELKKSRVSIEKSAYIKVGTKVTNNLVNFTSLLPVALFTGSYKWSLKRRSLVNVFNERYNGCLELAAINIDDTFRKIISKLDVNIVYYDELPYIEAIKLGVITDNFLSGFKLKALELIHSGCCLVSFSNISVEFDDIIYAGLFVKTIKKLEQLDDIYNELLMQPDVLTKFKLFYKDVCQKFNWELTALEIKNTLSKI